jgi:hypothetical protein
VRRTEEDPQAVAGGEGDKTTLPVHKQTKVVRKQRPGETRVRPREEGSGNTERMQQVRVALKEVSTLTFQPLRVIAGAGVASEYPLGEKSHLCPRGGETQVGEIFPRALPVRGIAIIR